MFSSVATDFGSWTIVIVDRETAFFIDFVCNIISNVFLQNESIGSCIYFR